MAWGLGVGKPGRKKTPLTPKPLVNCRGREKRKGVWEKKSAGMGKINVEKTWDEYGKKPPGLFDNLKQEVVKGGKENVEAGVLYGGGGRTRKRRGTHLRRPLKGTTKLVTNKEIKQTQD